MTNWEDPELGLFSYDDYAWCREIDVPKLAAFKYSAFGKPGTKQPVYLMFEADDGPMVG